jgi:hypothetical protein
MILVEDIFLLLIDLRKVTLGLPQSSPYILNIKVCRGSFFPNINGRKEDVNSGTFSDPLRHSSSLLATFAYYTE